jgi:hypothetical protein
MGSKLVIIGLCVLAVCLYGCRSAPRAPEPIPVAGISKGGSLLHPAKAIEYKESATGEKIPAWVLMEPEEIAQLPEHLGSHVFIYQKDAEDLESLLAWARSFPAAAEVAGAVTDRMSAKYAQEAYAQKELAAEYVGDAAKIVAAAEYAGMIRRGDFWLHLQLYDDKGKPAQRVYRYLLVYTVPRAQVTAAIQRALREQDRTAGELTADEQAARDWVNLLFSEGL